MQTLQENTPDIQNIDYTIDRFSKQNLRDVEKLYGAVYGKPAAPDYFLKKYSTAYTGVEYVGYVAYNKDNIAVAYYGVIPCFVEYKNIFILAAQSADTMTHPKHRFKGMFVELSNKAFELCRQLGIKLIFGFPNQNSYHGAVNKLGWKMTGSMACFKIPVKGLPLESATGKVLLFGKLYKQYKNIIWNKRKLPLAGVSNSVLSDHFAGVYRSEEYLQYKQYAATKVLQIGEAKIWVSDNKPGIVIGDMEGVNAGNFDIVIDKIRAIARKSGIRLIQFHASPGTDLYALFADRYESTESFPMLFQNFGSAIDPEKIKFTFADIDIF